MRVLIVFPGMTVYGGAELLVVRLANYLSEKGIQNAVLTTNIRPEIEADLKGTQVIKFPFDRIKGGLKFFNLLRTIARLNKGIRKYRGQFDILNLHNYPATLAVFPYRIPCVWMCNEPPAVEMGFSQIPKGTLKYRLVKLILAMDRYIARKHITNAVVADEFNRARFLGLYGFKPRIVNYGIDWNFFSSCPPQQKEQLRDEFRVLHVGMLTPLKNQLESIKTIESLRSAIPNIRLILAGFGEGSYLSSLQETVRARHLEQHVQITGHLDRLQLRDLYRSCDVLLHPIKSQGGWLAPFEALCANLPIVVSTEMTAADLVRKHDLGIVTSDFPSGVLQVYKNKDFYARKAMERARWVRDNLSWDNFCEKMVESFSLVLKKK